MEHAGRVGVGERISHLAHQQGGGAGRDRIPAKLRLQVAAFQKIHGQKSRLTGLAERVHRDDVGMPELRDRAAFAQQPLSKPRVGAGRDQLQRHEPAQRNVTGEPHHAHAAAP
jgi:hypothetical protein